MSFLLDAEAITAAFQAAGFDDVVCGDAIVARREQNTVWEAAVDQSGRLRVSVTYMSAPPIETVEPMLQGEALVLIEHSATITVLFQLQDAGELPAVLSAVESIVRRQHGPSNEEALPVA
ncbi:MAG: hypothetical protein RMN25_10010 [Anaerolineae bacterium]|nr:hypothetical protein [Thermoflexales bacterium]MDW8408103.1 hypothetical protein [Anaerolineae bacterium]